MTLALLVRDELNGFYRSYAMLALWGGLPALSLVLYVTTPNLNGIPLAVFTSLIVGALGGSLGSAMLAVSIFTERERRVYDLFLVRPVKPWEILLAKFGAVYVCVAAAALLSIAVGLLGDSAVAGRFQGTDLSSLETSIVILVSMLAISSAAGVLIGVVSPSALVAVILVLYGGNQVAAAAVLPVLLRVSNIWFPLLPGVALSIMLLAGAMAYFGAART